LSRFRIPPDRALIPAGQVSAYRFMNFKLIWRDISQDLFSRERGASYLRQRNVHKRQVVHDILTHANNHQISAPTHCVCRRDYTALDPSAFEYRLWRFILTVSE
jgi:hypothetical protein